MKTLDHRPQVAARRRERMRTRLVTAAFSLAAEGGLEAVTIDAVIARAEVARGSFYKYFTSTDALMQAVGQQVSDATLETMNPVVSTLDDPAQRIAVGVRTVLHLVQHYPTLGGFLVRSGWPVRDLTPLFYEQVGETLSSGIRAGRFHPMPTALALSAVAGTLVGAMHAQTTQDMPPDFPECTAATVLRALGLPATQAQAVANTPLPLAPADFAVVFARFASGAQAEGPARTA